MDIREKENAALIRRPTKSHFYTDIIPDEKQELKVGPR